jgi:hypothetical protein
LEGPADSLPADLEGLDTADILPLETNGPHGEGIEAGDHIKEGRLPGAIGSDEADDLSRGNLEVDPVQSRQAAEVFGYPHAFQ